MKFMNLLKKELRELINAQMIFSLVLTVVLMMAMGGFMSNIMDEASTETGTINICDRDNTDFTRNITSYLESTGFEVNKITDDNPDKVQLLKDADCKSLLIIPEGFSENALKTLSGEPESNCTLELVSAIRSTSALAMMSDKTSSAVDFIETAVRNQIMIENGLSEEEVAKINSPFEVKQTSVVNENSTEASADMVISFLQTQGMMIPLIVFMLVMFTSQMIITAISTEKINKTLETLLSAPVSRISVLSAKMLSAAIVAILNAVVYMIGMSSMMSSQINSETINSALTINDILKELGLKIGFTDYVMIGLQMFMTIMICLAISLILGAMVNDAKSAQTMIMPIMVLAMIPYFVSMLYDINLLPPVLKILIYAIPFTHTFNATNNIMFGNTAIYWGGLAYQAVLFAVCMFLAVKLFTSDKIFTISLNLGQKKKFKKGKEQ